MTKEEVIDIVKDAGFGFLSTLEGDQPRVRPMMPLISDDNKELMVALLARSRTIAQVKKDPKVEFCFVDRKMWYCRIAGQARIAEDMDKKEFLWNNIPMLKQYFGSADDPNFVLMVVDIKEVEAMTPHQKDPEVVDILV